MYTIEISERELKILIEAVGCLPFRQFKWAGVDLLDYLEAIQKEEPDAC